MALSGPNVYFNFPSTLLWQQREITVYLNSSFRLDAYKCILSDPSYNIKSQLARSAKSAKRTSCEATSLRSRQGARSAASIPHCCAYWQRQCGVLLLSRRTPTAGPTIGSVSAVLYAVSRCLAFIPIVSEVPSNQELSALGLAAAHPGSPDKRC